MMIKDQLLLENAYDQVLFSSVLEQYKETIVNEGVFQDMSQISQAVQALASINITDISNFISNIGSLAKSVVVAGGLSTVGVYVIGSILKMLSDKRSEVETLTKENILSIARANSKQQLQALAEQYEQGDKATKQRIINQQNKVLSDAIKRVEDQSTDKSSSKITSLMSWTGNLLKQNSFILGLLLQVILGYFGIITYPSLLPLK